MSVAGVLVAVALMASAGDRIVGTDISASDDSFGLNGLIYYMVAKAHLNPDRLDFDTLYGDYLAAAFGPAAGAMRTWFDRLEAFGNEIGDETIPQKEDVRSRKAAQAKRRQLYAERFDTAAFAKILDEAEKARAALIRINDCSCLLHG